MGMGSLPYGKSLLPRPFAAIAGLLVVSAAAVGGWFAAGQLADQPVVEPTLPTMNVSSGAATVQLRAGWQLETKVPKVPGLATADVKVLAPQDGGKGRMLVTMLPGETAALPQATMDALRVPLGKPQRASLGGERATGYTALSLQGVNGLVGELAGGEPAAQGRRGHDEQAGDRRDRPRQQRLAVRKRTHAHVH